jgi:hypothetical protein
MHRFGLALLVTTLAAAGACAEDVERPTYEYGLFPKVAHSGFNKTATFKVMFATSAPDPEWSVEDPSIATIAPSDPPVVNGIDTKNLRFALATMTKGGTTNVIMTAGGTSITSELQVKEYTDEQVAIGKTRYEVGTPGDAARPACASCHQKPGGVDHSPLKMAGFDDPTILGVIQNATYPANATGGSTTSPYAPTGPLSFTGHKWNLTDPEKDGILAHLRSLPLGKVAADLGDAGAVDASQ